MKLDETQRQKVAAWIEAGLKLADIQKRLETELGLRMTYLDVRLLVDDLKLKPKDQPEPPKPVLPSPDNQAAEPETEHPPDETQALPTNSKVQVSVDQIARAGALISGKVTFSDGKSADWFLDQTGRLGISPAEKGYKPPATDLQEFQMELQSQLQRLGFV
jgi:hypothetical protein